MAQCLSKLPWIVCEEMYSPIMNIITFRCLINLVVSRKLNIQLMDVVIAYRCKDLDMEIS